MSFFKYLNFITFRIEYLPPRYRCCPSNEWQAGKGRLVQRNKHEQDVLSLVGTEEEAELKAISMTNICTYFTVPHDTSQHFIIL